MSEQIIPIKVECVGEPDNNDNSVVQKNNIYRFDQLPENEAVFYITVGELKCCLRYDINGLEHGDLLKFVEAQKNNSYHCLSFRPGANQSSSILTQNGNTLFSVFGAGGDNPVSFDITVPNKYCLTAFSNLLDPIPTNEKIQAENEKTQPENEKTQPENEKTQAEKTEPIKSSEDNQNHCAYCGQKVLDVFDSFEFFPHEGGGYCIFAPRNKIDYACEKCAHKQCEYCGEKQIRYAFIECQKCGKVHCYNNTDMRYEGNPFLSHINLCNARHCGEQIESSQKSDPFQKSDPTKVNEPKQSAR